MTFEWALTQLRDGQPVTRETWGNGGQVTLTNRLFHYQDDNGTAELYEFSAEDILAGDWQSVNLDMGETPLEPKFNPEKFGQDFSGEDPFS